MGKEVDLLINYPKVQRDIKGRSAVKTEQDREIAKKFGKEYFDGERKHGYGGYNYNSKFWHPVVPTFKECFDLNSESSLLDVGCGKGFMLYDLNMLIPSIRTKGIDISEYAIENAIEDARGYLQVADARDLPFDDNSFDVTISINTVHNLDREDCAKALREIERVSKKGSFITVDAYRTEEEKELMFDWNLTAKTVMSVEEWKIFFKEIGYTGNYYWFMP